MQVIRSYAIAMRHGVGQCVNFVAAHCSVSCLQIRWGVLSSTRWMRGMTLNANQLYATLSKETNPPIYRRKDLRLWLDPTPGGCKVLLIKLHKSHLSAGPEFQNHLNSLEMTHSKSILSLGLLYLFFATRFCISVHRNINNAFTFSKTHTWRWKLKVLWDQFLDFRWLMLNQQIDLPPTWIILNCISRESLPKR